MAAAAGILTRTGGATSHAAVVARAMNKPAVVSCTALSEELESLESKKVTIDGATGKVWLNVNVPVIDSSKNPVVTMLADKVAIRDGLRIELPIDQFIGSTVDAPGAGDRCNHLQRRRRQGAALEWCVARCKAEPGRS